MRFKVLCMLGPTASGKTDLSLQLADDIPCEIVSVDSAMVYKEMDIGTAKPTCEQRAKVKHHLIDITSPLNAYSAAKFQTDALAAINAIHARGNVPILVGGTMLYFKALQHGLSPLPCADETVRSRLSNDAVIVGWQEMHTRLAAVDSLSAQRISPHDAQRIQRALEVYEISGKPLSYLWQEHKSSLLPFDCINVAIAPLERKVLHERIANRFLKMLQAGFIEEVEKLHQREELHLNLPAMRSVGYRQVWQFLEGNISYPELCEVGIAATRQLAKRQMTWLRHWNDVTWFDSMEKQIYRKFLQFFKQEIWT